MTEDISERDREAVGIPSNKTLAIQIAGGAALLLFFGYVFGYRMFWASPIYAKKIARIDIATLDTPITADVPAAKAEKLFFVLTARRYTKSGYNEVLLRAEALRQGKPVAQVDCSTLRLKGNGSATIVGSSAHNDDCDMRLPAGGADAVRVTLRLKYPKNSVTYEGMQIELASE